MGTTECKEQKEGGLWEQAGYPPNNPEYSTKNVCNILIVCVNNLDEISKLIKWMHKDKTMVREKRCDELRKGKQLTHLKNVSQEVKIRQ